MSLISFSKQFLLLLDTEGKIGDSGLQTAGQEAKKLLANPDSEMAEEGVFKVMFKVAACFQKYPVFYGKIKPIILAEVSMMLDRPINELASTHPSGVSKEPPQLIKTKPGIFHRARISVFVWTMDVRSIIAAFQARRGKIFPSIAYSLVCSTKRGVSESVSRPPHTTKTQWDVLINTRLAVSEKLLYHILGDSIGAKSQDLVGYKVEEAWKSF
jgi:hypothetical protein